MLDRGNVLVTGGAGFIGSNFILSLFFNKIRSLSFKLINLDNLTYAGNLSNLKSIENHPHYIFVKGDISDRVCVKKILDEYHPIAIINFAAETHVDRSINDASPFIQTNIVGTHNLLLEALAYFNKISFNLKNDFRFLHVSTDEVYGTLNKNDLPFEEINAFKPNSPYAASKASSDHLVRAYFETYQLPTLITNCSNNYGPYQFPEKLIPLCLIHALKGKQLPLYGDGRQIRDWLYVADHCDAITLVLNNGDVGQTYNVGGRNEKTNIEVVNILCEILDELKPRQDKLSYKTQITFVKDRPGHDRRYAINAEKIKEKLNWKPSETFETGIRKTVQWYLDHFDWVEEALIGNHKK